MRRRIMFGVGVVVAVALWLHHGQPDASDPAAETPTTADTGDTGDTGSGHHRSLTAALRAHRSGALPAAGIRRDGTVMISGTVIDRQAGAAVGDVEVVFRSEAGEESIIAGADGAYRIELTRGTYRAFVRDDRVLSVGRPDHQRLPSGPDADAVGLPDESAMPIVVATHDTDHVDLAVVRGGTIYGHVRDREGTPIARAIVRARGVRKPVLGTDVVETDASGAFSLRVPIGMWHLDATHPSYAGPSDSDGVWLRSGGERAEQDLVLVAGCVITGRVLTAAGATAGEGAIEKRWGSTELEFSPTEKIAADGTFRWVTTEPDDEVTLRAWPWKSPPSPARTFACRDGARFDDVVFRLPSRGPDIEGTLADAAGNPVALAYIDLAPLDPGGISQQERTDVDGKWAVFQMPAGRYQVTAYAPGRGAVSTVISAPQTGVKLALGGTGKLEGTIPIENGSFEVRIFGCTFDGRMVTVPDDARIVGVVGGKFSLENLPACTLSINATWNTIQQQLVVTIPPGGTATTAIEIGHHVDLGDDGGPQNDIEIIGEPEPDEPDPPEDIEVIEAE